MGFVELVGILVVGSFLLRVAFVLLASKLLKPLRKGLTDRYGPNSWAIVTGASDGIGKGFCEELAKDGFNVILVARTKDKLDKVAQSLQQLNPKIQTKVVVADFKNAHNRDFLQNELSELQNLDISLVVNNVGVDIINDFHNIPDQQLYDMMSINIFSVVRFTKTLLPQLIKRNKRSAIVNVASVAGLRPLPYFTSYSATKAFVNFFSQALSIEYSNIDIISLTPFYVSTQLTHHKAVAFDTITPNACARGTLDDLGLTKHTYGGWQHKVLGLSIELTPDFVYDISTKHVGAKFEMERRRKVVESLAKTSKHI